MNQKELDDFIIKFNEFSLLRQRKKIFNKPNFIGVGAGRCGTTSIYQYLANHPDVYMSPVKEINYFGIRNLEKNKYGINFREYLYYFLAATNQKRIGEISPVYLNIPESASLIKEKLGNVKILITLREPIERIMSQYNHHFEKHQIDDINEYLKKGIEGFQEKPESKYLFNWFHPTKNITQSLYFESVKTYIEELGKENILIVAYDRLKDSGSVVLQEICQFLEIEYIPNELEKANSSSTNKTKNIQLSSEVIKDLVPIFKDDLAKLDELTGLKTFKWLEKYHL